MQIDVDHIEPQVAFPHSPDNVRNVSECAGISQEADDSQVIKRGTKSTTRQRES